MQTSARMRTVLALVAGITVAGIGTAQAGWAVLAIDFKGHWGYAVGYANEVAARSAATNGCGNPGCKVVASSQGKCLAYWHSLAGGGFRYGVGIGPTGSVAMNIAGSGCGFPKLHCVAVGLRCG